MALNQPKLDVALCAVPMFGHFMPLISYAEELLRRGHSVTIFHESDAKYRHKLEQCGLGQCKSVPYDGKNQKEWGDSIYNGIRAYYDGKKRPDIMVYDFFAADAADAADQMGIPAVGVFPNPRSVNPWAATLEEQETLQWTLWSFACCGLEAVLARFLWYRRAKKRWSRSLPLMREQDLYPSPFMPRHILGSMAPALEFPNLPSAPLYHMVGPSLPTKTDPIPQSLQKWMDAQTLPIVYVAFGTQYRHTSNSLTNLEADLWEMGSRVAVLWSLPVKDQTELRRHPSDLPPHIRVESFVPQTALLQSGQVSVFVTHCGSNSMNEALLSGVPMVCCPGKADQPANASRLARAGVGVIAKNKKQGVGVALRKLLDNLAKTSQTSQALAKDLQSLEGAKQGSDWIERIAREGQPPLKGPGRWPWWPMVLLAVSLPMLRFL